LRTEANVKSLKGDTKGTCGIKKKKRTKEQKKKRIETSECQSFESLKFNLKKWNWTGSLSLKGLYFSIIIISIELRVVMDLLDNHRISSTGVFSISSIRGFLDHDLVKHRIYDPPELAGNR